MLVEVVSSVLFAKTSFAIGITIAIQTSKIDIYKRAIHSFIPSRLHTKTPTQPSMEKDVLFHRLLKKIGTQILLSFHNFWKNISKINYFDK